MKGFCLLLLVVMFQSCMKNERNCADFKTGKFEFTQTINGVTHKTIFERTNNLQIETYQGKTDSASVRWINDCEYILTNLHPKNREERKAISMKIISTKENTYTFEYGYVGDSKKQTGIVTKID